MSVYQSVYLKHFTCVLLSVWVGGREVCVGQGMGVCGF